MTESVILLTELTDEELINSEEAANQTIEILVQNKVWNFLIRLFQKLDDNEDDERK